MPVSVTIIQVALPRQYVAHCDCADRYSPNVCLLTKGSSALLLTSRQPTRFLHCRNLRFKAYLARTEELKQNRNQGGTGNVVILAGQESAMRVRKNVRYSRDRIAEFLGTLLPTDYQRRNGDCRTSLVQYGPVAENRQVVRRCVNYQLVPSPRVWHQERHRKHKRSRGTVDVGHEEPPHRHGRQPKPMTANDS